MRAAVIVAPMSRHVDEPSHHHHHSHVPANGPPNSLARRVRHRATVLLAAVLVPLGIATVVGIVVLWPDGTGPQDHRLDRSYYAAHGSLVEGTISAVRSSTCPRGEAGGTSEQTCVKVQVRLTDGPQAGSNVPVDLLPQTDRAGIKPGDQLRLMRIAPPGQRDYYAFVDFERDVPVLLLALIYAVVVVAVARLRGLRALLGLAFAYAVLATFMLPSLLEGEPPLAVGLAGSAAIMFVVLYVAHGFSTRTTTALLGTLFGLGITGGLAWIATDAAQLTGLHSEDGFTLLSLAHSVDTSKIILCGIIIAGLGLLNDVTITQASAVWELHELSPSTPASALFRGAMRIGRDHIASTVYTIAFAYAGAALPTLLLISIYQRPFLTAVTSDEIAEEVVRTLVGSIGLVLAIPVTTAIAVAVAVTAGRRRRHALQNGMSRLR
jgi:uncharacterized membrane protein